MKLYRSILFLVTILLFLLPEKASAQLFARNHARSYEKPPKAVLVQLFTYPNKRKYYHRIKRPEVIEQMNAEAENVIKKTVKDFNENFSYAPVYYYYDSNINYVVEQEFEGVLLDKNLQPVSNPVISKGDSNYVVALYGYNTVEPTNDVYRKKDWKDFFVSNYASNGVYRLIVLDHNLRKLSRPLPNGSNNINRSNKSELKYKSRRFNIRYEDSAGGYDEKLLRFYGPYPY